MKIINNITEKLSDELKQDLRVGGRLSIAASQKQLCTAEALILPRGQQPRQQADQLVHAADLLAHAALLCRIVPSDCKLYTCFQQRPAEGDHNIRLRIRSLRHRLLCPLPEEQH